MIDVGTVDVDIDIDVNDISDALSEAFAAVPSSRHDGAPDRRDVLRVLNNIASFFNGLKDEHIALLTASQRSTTEQFLQKNANRFAIGGLFVPAPVTVAPQQGGAQPPDGGGASNIKASE